MTPQTSSLAHDVTTFEKARATREYLRKRQGTALETQSTSPPYTSSQPPLSLRTYALDGRSADPWVLFHGTQEITQRKDWLDTALVELNDVDQEAARESLPEIFSSTKDQARRILSALATQSIAPTVYPTEDGEIALYFKPLAAKSAVLILVGNDGQGACFSYVNGKNRRARYDDASELPDGFVREQLRRLTNT